MAAVRRRPRRRGSPKSKSTFVSVNPVFFLISGEMGKKLLGVNTTDSVFSEFLLHRMFNCKQRSR